MEIRSNNKTIIKNNNIKKRVCIELKKMIKERCWNRGGRKAQKVV